jgi:branched-chain amino acid transport system ATP-binding protein
MAASSPHYGDRMLEVSHLSKSFGGVAAVADVSLAVAEGGITALIGPNGAGKTTLFALISGFLAPDAGRIRLEGIDIAGAPPHRLAARGLVRTFQLVQFFAGLSVRENIAIGCHLHTSGRAAALEAAATIAQRIGMAKLLDQPAGALTLAARKRLELARALATRPKLILLDEVMAGLNPSEIAEMVAVIRSINATGITLLLTEHVMQAVMSLAAQVYVLSDGRIIAAGTPDTIVADPIVIEAYLGAGAARRLASRHGGAHA